MGKARFRNVDEYISVQPKAAQAVLDVVRGTFRKALPRAEEVISYQMPAYKMGDDIVLYFAGWKAHYSLYPADGRMIAFFNEQLTPYNISKGTIRFSLSEPVPVKLIERIAKFRAKEAIKREKSPPTGQASSPCGKFGRS
jgi:uncharacterized protein YdhG (YjbR/CyaY superfamily)